MLALKIGQQGILRGIPLEAAPYSPNTYKTRLAANATYWRPSTVNDTGLAPTACLFIHI